MRGGGGGGGGGGGPAGTRPEGGGGGGGGGAACVDRVRGCRVAHVRVFVLSACPELQKFRCHLNRALHGKQVRCTFVSFELGVRNQAADSFSALEGNRLVLLSVKNEHGHVRWQILALLARAHFAVPGPVAYLLVAVLARVERKMYDRERHGPLQRRLTCRTG